TSSQVGTSADTASEDYNDLDVDEVMAAISNDEPGSIESTVKTDSLRAFVLLGQD
ncbi:hypothetical protein MMC15_008163, partial [Xylographa vitiligo]|nr:hypothetical protein [Xylographa vitiligo]